MTAQAEYPLENRIRKGLKIARLVVAYAPFSMVRKVQHLALYRVTLPQEIQTSLTDRPPGEWFVSKAADKQSPVILYLHGGGFVLPQSHLHRVMLAKLTHEVKGRTFMLDYRLAPEYPFPAALDDCLAAYQYLLNEGYSSQQITVMGDSAGANLTLVMLIALRDRGIPLPRHAIAISAPTDFTEDNPGHGKPDDILHPRAIVRFSNSYLADQDVHNPLISPLFADLHGLPPLLLYAGGDEALASDSVRFAQAAEAAGVEVTLRVYPRMWHVWQLTPDLPQAQQSLAEIADAIRAVTIKTEYAISASTF